MRLWRIVARKSALDTQCEGARIHGGRWNPIGCPAMYAGTTIELCALEKFVHLINVPAPPLVLVAIDVPDDESLTRQAQLSELPKSWFDLPTSVSAQEVGRTWLEEAAQLVLLVPSAIVPEAMHAVINPVHPAYKKITLQVVRPFSVDARLWKPS